MKYSLDDTIAAISTPIGDGGIGIVRLSGRESLSIADRIFKPKDAVPPSKMKSYTTRYGHIVHDVRKKAAKRHGRSRDKRYGRTDTPGEVIDEVILTVMRAPKSYTKEDIVEINCHGGITPLKNILELVFSFGARLAQPGEFTMRAFLNGRIDLTQAESVLDVIRSKTDAGLRAAVDQLEGGLSEEIKGLREELIDLACRIEASIDFPEETVDTLPNGRIADRLNNAVVWFDRLIASADKGIILMEGIRAVICGRPNVGKSSLMNSLLRRNRVIVSHLPGTTRDVIEEAVNIKGIPLRVIDTAGITEGGDLLTKKGVEKSRFYIRAADLVLFLLDGSGPLTASDKIIMKDLMCKKVIVVINKTDLPMRLELGGIKEVLCDKKIIEISIAKRKNLKMLEEAISDMIWGGGIDSDHTAMVTNARHRTILIRGRDILKKALRGVKRNIPPEFTAFDIREAIRRLGEITGETIDVDILNKIFSRFCIGK